MSNLFSGFSVGEQEVNILFNILLAFIAGIIITTGYIFGHKDKKYSKNFAITIFLFPIIMTVVIPFIATDLKKAVSLAGVFALVRFRSIPGDSKDILYVFFTLAVGIIIGLNSYIVAFVITILISVLFVLTERNWKSAPTQTLKITIPENMDYNGVFDEIFTKYLEKHAVKNVRTSNMGTLFTITYLIQPKKDMNAKAFIDELRTKNGNLSIIISNRDLEVPEL